MCVRERERERRNILSIFRYIIYNIIYKLSIYMYIERDRVRESMYVY